jgi:hypothetical protein
MADNPIHRRRSDVLPRVLLMLSFVFAGASAVAAMSECQAECEKNYKYCVDKRAKSEKACRVDYEKCRQQCAKKEGKPGPG